MVAVTEIRSLHVTIAPWYTMLSSNANVAVQVPMDLVQEPALAPAQEPQVRQHAAFFLYHLLLLFAKLLCSAAEVINLELTQICMLLPSLPSLRCVAYACSRRCTIAVLSCESAFTWLSLIIAVAAHEKIIAIYHV